MNLVPGSVTALRGRGHVAPPIALSSFAWPWQPLVMQQLKTRFENFSRKKKGVGTIDIVDLCNREVSKFSQRIFVIATMLVEKPSAIELH